MFLATFIPLPDGRWEYNGYMPAEGKTESGESNYDYSLRWYRQNAKPNSTSCQPDWRIVEIQDMGQNPTNGSLWKSVAGRGVINNSYDEEWFNDRPYCLVKELAFGNIPILLKDRQYELGYNDGQTRFNPVNDDPIYLMGFHDAEGDLDAG